MRPSEPAACPLAFYPVSSSPVLLCASSLRPPRSLGPDRIVRVAGEAGFEGIAVDAEVTLDLLPGLAAQALRSGSRVEVAACPLAEAPLEKGKRLPSLAATDDPEERVAAVKIARRTLEAGHGLGIRTYELDLGAAGLRASEAELRRRFARREMDEGEPGRNLLRRVLEERKARAGRLADVCRAALEPLLVEAERRGATLVIPLAATPWQLASPREAELFLREFSGAPLALHYAPVRREILRTLRLGGPTERWDDLVRATRLVLATDGVGIEEGLPLGTGELPPSAPLTGLPPEAHVVIGGPYDTSFHEILRAKKRAAALIPASPPRAPDAPPTPAA